MSTLYYVEVDAENLDLAAFPAITTALKQHIHDRFVVEMHPDEWGIASWSRYMDVFGIRTKAAHRELCKAIQDISPNAHVTTRWLDWEDISWDGQHGPSSVDDHDDDHDDNNEDKD